VLLLLPLTSPLVGNRGGCLMYAAWYGLIFSEEDCVGAVGSGHDRDRGESDIAIDAGCSLL
jgi:hypothetical protein